MKKIMLFCLFSSLYIYIFGQSDIKGNLVIVGGGLNSDNAIVHNKFIELAGGKAKAIIGIIPTASTVPAESFDDFKKDLIKYGISEKNIILIPIALIDDPITKNLDESTWAENANSEKVAKDIQKCTGIWFVGGDQMRITQAFFKKDQSNTIVLDAIWNRYKNGAVLGGTSAGAAIMSDPMIGGGLSFPSLSQGVLSGELTSEQQDNGAVYLTRGLGFFNYGMVDQHFDKRARIGRLAIALSQNNQQIKIGFGIDENTALVVYNQKQEMEFIGESAVTVLNLMDASITKIGKKTKINNIELSLVEGSDKYDISKDEFIPNPIKKKTTGNEYYKKTNHISGILNLQSSNYKELITYSLIDNKAAQNIINYSFNEKGTGFKFTFSKKAESLGFITESADHIDHYSVVKIRLDIEPGFIFFAPQEDER